jgi:hypothetical protein
MTLPGSSKGASTPLVRATPGGVALFEEGVMVVMVVTWEDKIRQEVDKQWLYIRGAFRDMLGAPLTKKEALDRLFSEFKAKYRRRAKPVVLTAELEVLEPMPYKATVYRKQGGKWREFEVEGMTPLTVHIIGEVEYDSPGAKKRVTMKVYHRFIGKTFPQYTSN